MEIEIETIKFLWLLFPYLTMWILFYIGSFIPDVTGKWYGFPIVMTFCLIFALSLAFCIYKITG